MTESTIQSTDAVNMYKGQKSMLIMVIAKSGRGKSRAMKHLDPSKTFLINVMGKQLPFPKGIQYVEGKNMIVQANSQTIQRAMQEVSRGTTFDTIVIDDAQYIMATEFMNNAQVKGYDKFTMMAKNFWDIMALAGKLRSGLKIFILSHEEETATGERKMKTLGKLTDEKLTIEGLSSIVVYGDVIMNEQKREYYFNTQSDGYTNAKTPEDMFPQRIPNDLKLMSDRIDEYYQGIELKDSKLNFEIGA